MVNIVVAIVIIAIAVLATVIADRIMFYPGRLRVWQTWFKHYFLALREIRHLMLSCNTPPALESVKDQLVIISKIKANALARIGDRDLRKTIEHQYLLTWQACDRWIIHHEILSEQP